MCKPVGDMRNTYSTLQGSNAKKGINIQYVLCKFEIFWLFFEPYLIMHWSTCVFGP